MIGTLWYTCFRYLPVHGTNTFDDVPNFSDQWWRPHRIQQPKTKLESQTLERNEHVWKSEKSLNIKKKSLNNHAVPFVKVMHTSLSMPRSFDPFRKTM